MAVVISLPGCGDAGDSAGAGGVGLEALRARLGDRLFEFGSSSGNSDRNAFVSGIHQLQLCKAGIFAWKETTSFSSNVGSMTSDDLHTGTWTLGGSGGGAVVELKIEQSSAKSPPATRHFRVDLDGDAVRFDGAAARDNDVTADCEQGARERR